MGAWIEGILEMILEYFYWKTLDDEAREKVNKYVRVIILGLIIALVIWLILSR